MITDEEKKQIIDYVSRWGNGASDALLDPNCQFFRNQSIEGVIGYRIISGFAIVFGDPVSASADRAQLALAFNHFCQEQGLKTLYIVASEEFAKWSLQHVCKMLIEVAEILILDPQKDLTSGSKKQLLRRNIKHAAQEGVSVQEHIIPNAQLEKEMEDVGKTWIKGRQGTQTYLSHVVLFDDRVGRRWFYAKQNGRLIGVLMLNKVENGWLLNHLISLQDSPRGTSELLVVSALEQLAKEACHFFISGVVPRDEVGEMIGMGRVSKYLIRQGYKIGMKVLRLKGRRRYWDKFQPEIKRSYLAFSSPRLGISEIRALIQALNTPS